MGAVDVYAPGESAPLDLAGDIPPRSSTAPAGVSWRPAGPVLRSPSGSGPTCARSLRSSPTPEGRCCARLGDGLLQVVEVAILTDPGGPVLPLRLGGEAGGAQVAILTDPGGPVLPTRPSGCCCSPAGAQVAILTGPGGPVLPRPASAGSSWTPSCDPHRPRRAGAATPRCCAAGEPCGCCDPHRPRRAGAAVRDQHSWCLSLLHPSWVSASWERLCGDVGSEPHG